MARFFKYKSLDDIREDVARLGLGIEFSDDLSPLCAAVQIGSRRVGNAVAIHPMEGCDATLAGTPDELTFRRYDRFGASGAKIIWGEAAAVVREGRANPRQLVVSDVSAGGLQWMVETCRAAHCRSFGDDSDLLVGLQLTHSGRYSFERPYIACHDPLLDPRTVVNRSTGATVTASYALLSDDELRRLEDAYVAAARVAFGAGFDFVDVKQCHRYLLSELLAAKTRPGPYGGSFENRTRFVRNVIGRIRQECPNGIVCSRTNIFDGVPFDKNASTGIGEPAPFSTPVTTAFGVTECDPLEADLAEPRQLLAMLRDLGVPMVNISMGNPYAVMHVTRPFEYPPPDGYESPEHPLVGVWRHFRLAGELQRAFPDLVLVGSGYSWLQAFVYYAGAANIHNGAIRVMGIGRAALAYPDSIRDALSGRPLDRRRVCRTFSYCTALMRAKHNELGQFPTGCPPFDADAYGDLWKAAQRPTTESRQ